MSNAPKPILVVGGGIAGMTAAIEAAETGYPVVLVEKDASLGGRVLRMYKYFPKMCPPACGYEINLKRLRRNPGITVYTLSTVREISRRDGRFRVTLLHQPRYVTGVPPLDVSAGLGITSTRPNDFNYGMSEISSLGLPHDMAFPPLPLLDIDSLTPAEADQLLEKAPSGAIDLDQEEATQELEVGAIILATGWHPYDAARIENLGFGRIPNVLTNVLFERLAAADGPTGGKITCPADGSTPGRVAFVQCAGSRDENHLPYCSAVCCMASLKQARYLREAEPETLVTLFYIDIRTIGRLERFYLELLEDPGISFVKGKVARITEDQAGVGLVLDVEDTIGGEKLQQCYDLAVLATGIVPNTNGIKMPFSLHCDEFGFLEPDTGIEGIFTAGCVARPCDVARAAKGATSAALKAVQFLRRGGHSDGW